MIAMFLFFSLLNTLAQKPAIAGLDWVDETGRLGGQALLALIGFTMLGLVVKMMKKSDQQYSDLLQHHQENVKNYNLERCEMNDERRRNFDILVALQKETNAALNANTAAVKGIESAVRMMTPGPTRRK